MNVFHEILRQMATSSLVKHFVRQTVEPDYFIQAAGTGSLSSSLHIRLAHSGGTISSVGRYVRKYQKSTTVVLADTEFSTYYDWVVNGKFGGNDSSGAQVRELFLTYKSPSLQVWHGPGLSGIGFGPEGALNLGESTR